MREVGHRLHNPLVARVRDLIEHERENDRRRERDDQVLDIQDNGVAEDRPEIGIPDDLQHILHAVIRCPRAPDDAQFRLVLLEGQGDTVHRVITEQHIVHEGKQHDQVQPFITLKGAQKASFQGLLFRRCQLCQSLSPHTSLRSTCMTQIISLLIEQVTYRTPSRTRQVG